MGQYISASKTALGQPLHISTDFGYEGHDTAIHPQAAANPADGAGVPCFVRGGLDVPTMRAVSEEWEEEEGVWSGEVLGRLPLKASSRSSLPKTMSRSCTAHVWNCTRKITSRVGLRNFLW